MDGISRRASGLYVARLAVPARHRQTLGKLEFIASTGTRDLALARIVAGQLVAEWRRQLHNLDRLNAGMDVLQLSLGSPLLLAGGFTSLTKAAQLLGFDLDELLNFAAHGRLGLYMRANALAGHVITGADCERLNGPFGVELTVPQAAQMPDHVFESSHFGVLKLREPRIAASTLLAGDPVVLVLLDLVPADGRCFAPLRPVRLDRDGIELDCGELERLRSATAVGITPAQIDAAELARQVAAAVPVPSMPPVNSYGEKLMSEAIESFMADRSKVCAPDQARRIRAACELFVELEGNLRVADVTRDRVRDYRDNRLTKVPERENKIRLKYGTKTVTESTKAVAGTNWPVLSAAECVKRMNWLSNLFTWLFNEHWTDHDLAKGLGRYSGASQTLRGKRKRQQDDRQPFTRAELAQIFSAQWYQDGRGVLTKAWCCSCDVLSQGYWGRRRARQLR